MSEVPHRATSSGGRAHWLRFTTARGRACGALILSSRPSLRAPRHGSQNKVTGPAAAGATSLPPPSNRHGRSPVGEVLPLARIAVYAFFYRVRTASRGDN